MCYQACFNATDRGNQVEGMHIVFVDFSKAFDLVDHAASVSKLASMVVSRSFWNIDTELPVREVTTSDFSCWGLSKPGRVFGEVPQGGVISPTLFNV